MIPLYHRLSENAERERERSVFTHRLPKTEGSREQKLAGAQEGGGSSFLDPRFSITKPLAFVTACLRDLSVSTRATLDNGPLIRPFHQTPRDGRGLGIRRRRRRKRRGRYESGQSFRSLRVARGYTINRFVAVGERQALRDDTLSSGF